MAGGFSLDDLQGGKAATAYFDQVLYLHIKRYGDAIWVKDTQKMKSAIDAIEDLMSKNIHSMNFTFREDSGTYFDHKKKLIERYQNRLKGLKEENEDDQIFEDAEYIHLRERFRLLMCLIGDTEHHPRNIVEDYQP